MKTNVPWHEVHDARGADARVGHVDAAFGTVGLAVGRIIPVIVWVKTPASKLSVVEAKLRFIQTFYEFSNLRVSDVQ